MAKMQNEKKEESNRIEVECEQQKKYLDIVFIGIADSFFRFKSFHFVGRMPSESPFILCPTIKSHQQWKS